MIVDISKGPCAPPYISGVAGLQNNITESQSVIKRTRRQLGLQVYGILSLADLFLRLDQANIVLNTPCLDLLMGLSVSDRLDTADDMVPGNPCSTIMSVET